MQHVSYLAHNVIYFRFFQCTRSVLHHRTLYVCLQSPVDAILKVVIGIPDLTKADKVIAGMMTSWQSPFLAAMTSLRSPAGLCHHVWHA